MLTPLGQQHKPSKITVGQAISSEYNCFGLCPFQELGKLTSATLTMIDDLLRTRQQWWVDVLVASYTTMQLHIKDTPGPKLVCRSIIILTRSQNFLCCLFGSFISTLDDQVIVRGNQTCPNKSWH